MTIIRTLIGIIIFFLGLFTSFKLWFKDDVSTASGVPALLVVWISSGIALTIIFWHLRNHKKLYWIPIVGAIVTHILMDIFMNNYKSHQLEKYGQETKAIVSFRDKVRRAKTTSEEVRYTYYVDGEPYFKYNQSETFILDNSVSIGDTLILTYLPNRPDWHKIKRVLKNNR